MRFAERLNLTRHAGEARLLDMAAGAPETTHVQSCALCQARLTDLRAWTRATAGDAAAVADAMFTPARLTEQRAAILRRLESAGRSARVIAFPAFTAAAPARDTIGTSRIVRWAAAAAAAGLMAGVASGHLLDWHPERLQPAAPQVSERAPAVPLSHIVSPPAAVAAVETLDEEGLLEAAYDRVSVDALEAIDDITPRAREYALSARPRRFP